jgi:Ca-activated chloride channel family protein
MKTRNVLTVLGFLIFATTACFADGLIVPIRPDLRVRGSWAVKYHQVHIRVRDQIADVSIDQAFVNTGSGVMEVQYLFPIPPMAAIDSLTLVMDGKELKGRILSAEEARRAYEEIVRTKRDPALLEYVNYGLYRTSAFPLLPGKEVRVAIHYTDVCRKDGEVVEVFYPLNTEKFSARPVEEVEVKVDLLEKDPIAAVYSPTHSVTIDRPAPEHVIASYKVTNDLPASDFRLMYQPAKGTIGATVLSYRPKDTEDGYFLIMVSPKPRAEKNAVSPKDLVLALDRSGSMSGSKIEQAKSSLIYILRNLNPGDRFNVIVYNDSVEALFPELVSNTRDNVEKALAMVDRIHPSGGTNMHDALGAAVKEVGSGAAERRSRYIFFLTDGLPTVGQTSEGAILKDTLTANATNARIFAMGIGYDVNVRLLDRLAAENRGVTNYVKEREPLEPRISSLYAKLKNPVMTDLALTWNGVKTVMTYPQAVPDLFDGDQILLAGRYDRPGSANVVLTGTYLGKSQTFRYSAEFAKTSDKFSYAFVEQLWAVRRIGFLLDQIQLNGKSAEVVDELVRLSKQYGIITPYTSFLADERTDLASESSLRRQGELAAQDLSTGIVGGVAQMNAANRAAMNQATLAPSPSSVSAGGAKQFGLSKLASYESDRTERLAGVQNVGNRALYRRGQQWIDSSVADRPVAALNAAAKTIVQFSEEYFRLAAASSPAENQILSVQQPGEELIVLIRGQLYRIK